MSLLAYLILLRPANVVTAAADILAGATIGGALLLPPTDKVWFLLIASCFLYAGGVALNDYLDIHLDAKERPERPLPSGRADRDTTGKLILLLFFMATALAFWVGPLSGSIALIIIFLVTLYNRYAKHSRIWGPITMGLCRSANLLLGMSVGMQNAMPYIYLLALPLLFIAAITMTSAGEVSGKNRVAICLALLMDLTVAGTVVYLSREEAISLAHLLPFLSIWLLMNLMPKVRAIIIQTPEMIMGAVKYGVLSLIPLNASYAAAFGSYSHGIVILALLPISILLAKKFAVT